MRISPLDIRQQQFTVKMFRGFDTAEVDAFLEDVADDYEAIVKENALLKEQLATHEERSRSAMEVEKTLKETLLTTQRLTEEMKGAAKREAQIVLRDAELHGEKLVEGARAEEAKIRNDIQALKRLRRQVVEELRGTLERYQRLLASEIAPEAGDASAGKS
jgi:cell division initiation protein